MIVENFNESLMQNHRGAMMELGEGLCKLRKMNFESGPFLDFEQDISAVLNFIYNTQIELAACEFFSFYHSIPFLLDMKMGTSL